jgi:hypothetical protein
MWKAVTTNSNLIEQHPNIQVMMTVDSSETFTDQPIKGRLIGREP